MGKVLFDTPFLSMLFYQTDRLPFDPATRTEVTHPKERIEHLIERLDADETKIIVPTQALAELLAIAGSAGSRYLDEINGNSVFEIAPFDQRAAIENGALEAAGARRIGTAPRQKVKVDRQIMAIARVHGVDAIYSDDGDIQTLGRDLGITVIAVHQLPLPAEQAELPGLDEIEEEPGDS